MADAGWYNDKSDPALARWHDGVDWTDHVLVKADWAPGVEPPPPQVWEPEMWQADEATRPGRFRIAVGSAAVLAVLVVAGVALAQGGGDDPSDGPPTDRPFDTSDRVSDIAGDLGDGTTIDPATIDPATIEPVFGDGTGTRDGSSSSSAGSGSSGTTKATTKGSGTVQRTETRTTSHIVPGSTGEVTKGDKSSVGNTTNTSIKNTFDPPPDTTPPATTPASTPESTTTTTSGPGT